MCKTSLHTITTSLLVGSIIFNISFSQENSVNKGVETYQKICGYCHDVGVGPDFRGRNLPASYIVVMARTGFQAMPAFPMSHIDNETLLETAQYIENLPVIPSITSTEKKD